MKVSFASLLASKKLSSLTVVLILVLAGGVSFYFYSQYQKAQDALRNPSAAAVEEAKTLVEKVGKLYALPQGETPTLATVSDKSKLADQSFFAHAENGDKVLIYNQAKKAILYRPSTNQIIEVAPVNNAPEVAGAADTQTASSSGTTLSSVSPTPAEVRVAVYNGTATVGLATNFAKQLEDKNLGLTIVKKDNANKKDYTKTLVVDVSGANKDKAAQLAKAINADVAPLPSGEDKPDADLLVIVGK